MKENGSLKLKSNKEEVCRFGQMVLCTKVIGKTAKLMVMVDLYMQMAMCMLALGKTTKLTVLESTLTKTELDMKENGKTISSMDKVWKLGLTRHPMKVVM